jgi:predicted GNAT family N-acyltransferase
VIRVRLGTWDHTGREARAVREAVFVIEQAIPRELEWDQWDTASTHAIAQDHSGAVLGTGRLLPARFDPAAPHAAHIGRMAVLAAARRHGTGGLLLQALVQEAARQGFTEAVLHAQSYVAAFYARHGFGVEGGEFLEAGIAHVAMRRSLADLS